MKKILLVLLAFTLIANFTFHCVAVDANAEQTENRLLIAANNLEVSSSTNDILEQLYNYDFELFRFICYSFLSAPSLIYPQAKEHFPEFKALEQRSDAGKALLAEYIKTEISVDESLSQFEKHKAYILEFLLLQSVYLNKLTLEEANLLFTAKAEKDNIRTKYINDGYNGRFVSGFDFSEAQHDVYSSAYAINVANTTRGNILSKYDWVYVTLSTRNGTSFTARQYTETLLQEDYDILLNTGDYYCGTANRLDNPTLSYNCHSYAWHSTSTSTNSYWIDYPTTYVNNDPHVEPVDEDNVSNGNIVVYVDAYGVPLHSGIVVSTSNNSIMLHSKWGAGGLYYHNYLNVPPEYCVDNSHTISYYVFNYRAHNYTAEPYNTQKHLCYCTTGNHSYYENHLWNSNHTQCMVCGFDINGSVMAIPEQIQ